MGAHERVLRVLKAAARFQDAHDPLYQEALRRLPGALGWHRSSVVAALRYCMETQVSEIEMASLLAAVPTERVVHLVLSSNVFVATVRAVVLAWASAPEVRIKASRREQVFPELLGRALDEQEGEGAFSFVDALEVGKDEAVHVYGSDATIAALRSKLPTGTRIWGHGHGFGVLLADRQLPKDALAMDLNLLEQRGCLSPRVLLWVGDEGCIRDQIADITKIFIDHKPQDLAARRSYFDVMQMVGEVFQQGTSVVGFQSEPDTLWLPPEPGMLHVARVSSLSRAGDLLRPWEPWITCVGGDPVLTTQLAQVVPRARQARLGRMQRPPLDGPVDLRTRAPRV